MSVAKTLIFSAKALLPRVFGQPRGISRHKPRRRWRGHTCRGFRRRRGFWPAAPGDAVYM